MKSTPFNEAHVLHELNHLLPSQTPLKDFIHHNSLPAFQRLKFYEAVLSASKNLGCHLNLNLDGYRKLYKKKRISDSILHRVLEERKGSIHAAEWKQKLLEQLYDSPKALHIGRLRAYWKMAYPVDLDNAVQPLLFRILCGYLDPDIASWEFPVAGKGLLNAVRTLEVMHSTSFFKSERAKQLLLNEASCTMENLLKIVVGDEAYFEQYLFDQQFNHHGWSGIASAAESTSHSISHAPKIELKEVILLELLLEIDYLDFHLGADWQPLATHVTEPPLDLSATLEYSEHQEVLSLWQDAFEWSYYEEVLSNLKNSQMTQLDDIGGQRRFWN